MNRSRASPIEERKEVSDTNIGNSVEEENAVHRTMSPPPAYDQKKSLAATGGTEYMRNSKDETSQNNPNNATNALGTPSGVAISGEMGSAQDEKNKGKFNIMDDDEYEESAVEESEEEDIHLAQSD